MLQGQGGGVLPHQSLNSASTTRALSTNDPTSRPHPTGLGSSSCRLLAETPFSPLEGSQSRRFPRFTTSPSRGGSGPGSGGGRQNREGRSGTLPHSPAPEEDVVRPGHGEGDELLQLPTAGPALGVGSFLRVSGGSAASRGQVPGVAEQKLSAVAPVFVSLAVAAQRLHPGGHPRVLAQVLRHLLRHVGPAGRGGREQTLHRERGGVRGCERPCHCGLHRRPSRERPSGGPNAKQQRPQQLNRPLPPAAGSFPFIASPPPSARASFRREPALPGRFAAPERPRRPGPAWRRRRARGGGGGGWGASARASRPARARPASGCARDAPVYRASPCVPARLCDAARAPAAPLAPSFRGPAASRGVEAWKAGAAEGCRAGAGKALACRGVLAEPEVRVECEVCAPRAADAGLELGRNKQKLASIF